VRGFPAWFLARTYHLALMPGMARRARLVIDRTTGLLFGRDSAELGQLGHPRGLDATSAGGTGASEAGNDEVASGAGVRLDD
jgi:NADH:ubiquinone reductase (H+-translocating)